MQHQPLYRVVLRQAWRLTWHQRLLWILGLFSAAIVSGGAIDILIRHLSWSLQPVFYFTPGHWSSAWRLDLVAGLWCVALFLLFLGLAIFLIFMMIRSYISLIRGAIEYQGNKKLNLEKLWHEGSDKFWPVLGTVVFFRVLISLCTILTFLPLFFMVTGQLALFWLILYPVFFFIGLVLAMIMSFLMLYVSAFVVLENMKWVKAVAMSWQLFIKNWLTSLEMAVIMFVIDLIFGLLVVAGVIIITLPVLLILIASRFIFLPALGGVAVFIGAIVATGLILWVAGFLGTFHVASWTLLFQRMRAKTALSKLVRWFGHWHLGKS